METFLNSRVLSDVEFILPPGSDRIPRTVRAHKQFLAMTNEVFFTKFFLNEPDESKFYIDDLHPDGFYGLLKYLYSGEFKPSSFEEAMFTRLAAKQYLDLDLIDACDRYIAEHLTPVRVCPLLNSLETTDIGLVDKAAIEMLKNSGAAVLHSDTFVESSDDTLKVILEVVAGVPEKLVIESVRRWALEKRRRQLYADGTLMTLEEAMRPFLPQLRFLNLSPVDFVKGPGSWELLRDSENYHILGNLIDPASFRLPDWTNHEYNARSQFHRPYRVASPWRPETRLPPSSANSISSRDSE
ncbi:BTB/POZ domain-containing protein 6-like isoform X2 [Amblyomma americanum]